jgi:hypothetical protein
VVRISRGISASADAPTIAPAAQYWVADTPIAAASGPAISAPAGIAMTVPSAS